MKQYIVDAFTDKVFRGNQAAVCVMDSWPEDQLMIDIAVENNFSETAFLVREEPGIYSLRWFTPGGEIDLCGHATLASAFTVLNYIEPGAEKVTFRTKWSGELYITRDGDFFNMDFPVYEYKSVPVTDAMAEACGVRPVEAVMARDLLMVLPSEEDVVNCAGETSKMMALDGVCQCVTAAGSGEFDCVSRVFVPKLAVPEDPVTGSSHCLITPYWLDKTGKTSLNCFQASKRSGVLKTRREGDRIILSGQAALFSIAELFV
jgi:PhzF family phenazine biosynthesis protein